MSSNRQAGAGDEKARGSVNHILVRSKDQSTLHLKAKKPKKGAPRHNNHIESMWSKVKKNMDIMSGYGECNSDSIISYNIINHNFIRPHSSLGTFVAERHGQDNAINMTPAMAGGGGTQSGLPRSPSC